MQLPLPIITTGSIVDNMTNTNATVQQTATRIQLATLGLTTTDYPTLRAAYLAAVALEHDEDLGDATRDHAKDLRAKLAKRVLHYHRGGTLG